MTIDFGARRGLRALVLFTTITLAVAVVADAAGAAPRVRRRRVQSPPPAELGATWLADQITQNGGFIESFGAPDVTDTAYAVLGLHAAKIGGAASNAAITFLEAHLGTDLQGSDGRDAPGALADDILAATAAGADPYHFGGTAPANDLVARLLLTQRGSGPDAGLFGTQDPTFDGTFRQGLALAALEAARVPDRDPRIKAGLNWLTQQQCANGLFQAYRAPTATACDPADPTTFTGPDTNSTGMALQGLAAWHKKPMRLRAIRSLHSIQNADGGFGFVAAAGEPSDPDSTALVIQGLVAYASKPTKAMWKKPAGTPLSALQSFQLVCADGTSNDGAFFFPGSRTPNVFATVQAVPAAALAALPLHASSNLGPPLNPLCVA